MYTEAIRSPFSNSNISYPGTYTHADRNSFTIAAWGNIDNDRYPDVWTINHANRLRNVMDDAWDKER
jgi:hypothetical protein